MDKWMVGFVVCVGVVLGSVSAVSAQTLVARLALTVGGEAELESSGQLGGDVDLEDESGFGFDFMALWPVSNGARGGLFLQYTDDREFDVEDSGSFDIGSTLVVDGAIELPFHQSGALSVHATGFGGLIIYLSDDDLEDIQELVDDDDETKLGYNLGGGAGLTYSFGEFKGRADFYGMYQAAELVNGNNSDLEISGMRWVLAIGAQF